MADKNKNDRQTKAKPEHHVIVQGHIQTHSSPEETERHVTERKEDAAAHEAERKEDSTREGHKVWIERLGLVAVTIYAGITLWQGCLIKKGNEINHEALISVQRAFVGLNKLDTNPVHFRFETKEENGWRFQAHWENTGDTAATNILESFSMDQLSEEPNDEEFRGKPIPQTINVTYIRPKGTLDSGQRDIPESALPVPGPEMKTIWASKKQMPYFWGWISYNDVFADTKLHVTEFCYQTTAIYWDQTLNKAQFNLVQCGRHNCVDSECSDYAEIAKIATKQK